MSRESNARVTKHILTDAKLTKTVLRSMIHTFTREAAAREVLEILTKNLDTPKTPAGDRYTMIAIRAAIAQLDREIFK